jgi:hypothetical protein
MIVEDNLQVPAALSAIMIIDDINSKHEDQNCHQLFTGVHFDFFLEPILVGADRADSEIDAGFVSQLPTAARARSSAEAISLCSFARIGCSSNDTVLLLVRAVTSTEELSVSDLAEVDFILYDVDRTSISASRRSDRKLEGVETKLRTLDPLRHCVSERFDDLEDVDGGCICCNVGDPCNIRSSTLFITNDAAEDRIELILGQMTIFVEGVAHCGREIERSTLCVDPGDGSRILLCESRSSRTSLVLLADCCIGSILTTRSALLGAQFEREFALPLALEARTDSTAGIGNEPTGSAAGLAALDVLDDRISDITHRALRSGQIDVEVVFELVKLGKHASGPFLIDPLSRRKSLLSTVHFRMNSHQSISSTLQQSDLNLL